MKLLLPWFAFLAVCFALAASTMGIARLQNDLINDPAKSTITYVLKHPIHTVRGTSHQVVSRMSFNNSSKTITAVHVTVPVQSFDSGNKTRDKDMRKVTEAATYPEVKFTSTQITSNSNQLTVTGQLNFHGITQDVTFQADQKLTGKQMVVDGTFPISLEAFKIKRPSIFGMAVKDEVIINFHMVYTLAVKGS